MQKDESLLFLREEVMSGNSINEIDFEHWAELASSDPEQFEKLRKDKISAVINNASGQRQQRLLGLQWKIDALRTRHQDSTVAACLAISGLMWETFNELAEVLRLQAESGLSTPVLGPQAHIVAFPTK